MTRQQPGPPAGCDSRCPATRRGPKATSEYHRVAITGRLTPPDCPQMCAPRTSPWSCQQLATAPGKPGDFTARSTENVCSRECI